MTDQTTAPAYDPAHWADKDPSPAEVRALAAVLRHHLGAYRPATAAEQQALAPVLGGLDRILDETTKPADVVPATIAVASDLDSLRTAYYHQPTGDLANNLLPTAWGMRRIARKAQSGQCRMGGTGPCSSPDDRVTVWVFDFVGAVEAGDGVGCPKHGAETALEYDHGGECEIGFTGSRQACAKTLAYLGGRLTPVPRAARTLDDLTRSTA